MTEHALRLNLPTPVRRLAVGGIQSELWLKQDGLTHARYGGNKARKAALLLEHAARKGARRVLTFGAAGSHHALSLALFAPEFGLKAAAVLTPQPDSEHARAVLGQSLNAGLEAYPARSPLAAAWHFSRAYQRGDYVAPPGGSSALGATAYALAVAELEAQVDAGLLPAPDWIVVPLGSGGTAAGLLAGLARSWLQARLLAVSVLRNPGAAAQLRLLANRTLRLEQRPLASQAWKRRLLVDGKQIGRGYGWKTPAGEQAAEVAARMGLELDPTYTAKAFAAALALARGEQPGISAPACVLYWHTLNAVPAPTPNENALPPELERLFIR